MANPFEDPPSTNFKPVSGTSSSGVRRHRNIEDEWDFYERQIETTMQDTLDSTKRSMRMLEESEDTGIKTAEELARQGEQLSNVSRKLDEMDKTTVETQKNLNNIKSVFGGVKNYFSRSRHSNSSNAASKPDNGLTTKLASIKEAESRGQPMPAGQTTAGGKKSKPDGSTPALSGGTLNADSKAAIRGTRWDAMDDEIDDNLRLMSANLSRLNALGVALGEETDKQNKQLDDIAVRTDKVDTKIRDQDKQMHKLLGTDSKPVTVRPQAAYDGADSSMTKSESSGSGWRFWK